VHCMGHVARIERSIDEQPTLVPAGHDDDARRYSALHDGAVRVLDEALLPRTTRSVTAEPSARLLAADAGQDAFAINDDGVLTILVGDAASVSVDVDADAAAFVAGRILATSASDDGHRVLLLDVATGDVLDEATVDADDAAAFISAHPSEPVVLAEFAMGQDGCVVVRVAVHGDRLDVQEVLAGQDAVIAGFDASGTRVLIVPHPNDPDAVRVLSWPSLDELARLSAEDLDTEIGIGLPACWVDDDRIALYAIEDSLVIADALLRSPERVSLPVIPGDDGDIESLLSLAHGRIAVGTWTPHGRVTMVVTV